MVDNENIKIVVANWKMFGNYDFTVEYFKTLCNAILPQNYKFIICPPFPYIGVGSRILLDNGASNIVVGAQNVSSSIKTANTGEISVEMLEDLLAKTVIIGHTERRALGENDAIVNKKLKNLQLSDVQPILCIGENVEEYNNKQTSKVLKTQIKNALKDIKKFETFIVAYEPTWAIGTGKTPTQEEISNIANLIEEEISKNCKVDNLYILYGGSVNETNMKNMLDNNDIDGVIVGSFGTKIQNFCNFFEELAKQSWKK